MKKTYREPTLDVKIYKLPYNSVFTDSGDNNDGDIYDITVNNGGNNIDNNVFGD